MNAAATSTTIQTTTNQGIGPNQALWEKGDFTVIAETMRASGEAVVDQLDVSPSMRVLDLGCGDGTTAVPLAHHGAWVTGIDIARNLVEAGRRRARSEGLTNLDIRHGDACDLQEIDDDSFDLSLSMFGAMFAPRPFDVARELVRVTRAGGRIVMGNWIAGDPTFVAQLLKISAAYSPAPPEGFVSPVAWGVESHIFERFGKAGIDPRRISLEKATYRFTRDGIAPAQFVERFRTCYGPTMNAYAAAETNGKTAQLHRELMELAEGQNAHRGGGIDIPATYMKVTVRV